MSRFNPTDVERQCLSRFRIDPTSGMVGLECSNCSARFAWDVGWSGQPLTEIIDQAWDHFMAGCK